MSKLVLLINVTVSLGRVCFKLRRVFFKHVRERVEFGHLNMRQLHCRQVVYGSSCSYIEIVRVKTSRFSPRHKSETNATETNF